jgi:SSS family solute:Na+ symporter
MGFYFSKKNTSTDEYFLGGRAFAGWVIGLSLVATSISSVTFIAYPGDAFKTAWLRYIPNFGLPIAAVFAMLVFIPFFRRSRATSAYEYLEARFGVGIRTYASVVYTLTQLLRLSIVLYLVSLLIHELTGLNLNLCVIVAGIFVGTYTIFGGIDAVIWTDVIQTVLLFLGGIFCLIIIVNKLPEGLSQIISVATADNKLSCAHVEGGQLVDTAYGFSLTEKTVSMLFIVGILSWMKGYTADQCTIQRYCTAKSTNDARKAVFVCVISSLPIWAFYMFLGTSLYVFFKEFPTQATTNMLQGIEKAEQVLPFFIVHYMPIGFKGLVIASALAASMSSLDSSINAVCTLGIVDVYKRHLVKGKDDRHYLIAARILATIASVIMILGALVLIHTAETTVRDMMVIVLSVFAAGLLGIYILGFFTTRGNARSVGVAIVCTVLFTLWAVLASRKLLPDFMGLPFDLYYTVIFGDSIMFMVGYLLSSFLKTAQPKDLTGLTIWTLKNKTEKK